VCWLDADRSLKHMLLTVGVAAKNIIQQHDTQAHTVSHVIATCRDCSNAAVTIEIVQRRGSQLMRRSR
jgi:hypothetical protein